MKRVFAVVLGLWAVCASGAGVYKAEYNTLNLDDHPMIVTNVTFDGLATTDEVYQAVVDATNNIPIPDMDQVISTNNPAFVAAVTNCPVAVDPEDASDLGDYGTYGTIGAILAALATGLAALKKGKQEKITASGILKGDGSGGVSTAIAGTDYQGVISDLSTIRSGAAAGATAVQPAALAGKRGLEDMAVYAETTTWAWAGEDATAVAAMTAARTYAEWDDYLGWVLYDLPEDYQQTDYPSDGDATTIVFEVDTSISLASMTGTRSSSVAPVTGDALAKTSQLSAASSASPQMDGTASAGSSAEFARGDHVHPSDTAKQDAIADLAAIRSGAAAGATAVQPATLNSYAPKASPAFTGTPTAPTPTAGDNSTNVATTAFVQSTLTSALGDIESALHTINTGSAS